MRISAEDRTRVCDAIREAERATSGEFVCVLARNASQYRFYPLAWSSLLALIVPWILMVGTLWPLQDILVAQLAVFGLCFTAFSWPGLRRYVVPRRVQRAVAHRAAAEQFLIRGLTSTPHRRGILLYVAEEEHYARVLADEGAASALPHDHWRDAVSLLVEHARTGRHAEGFVAALRHSAEVMRDAFPAGNADAKVLPDKFYVLD